MILSEYLISHQFFLDEVCNFWPSGACPDWFSELLFKQKELKVAARIVLFFCLISCLDWGSNGASQMFLIALCSFCVFIWISLVPARGFFGCSWHSWFSLIPFHVLLFQCVLVLLQILTTWYLSCACLGLFKIISLLDLRVYFYHLLYLSHEMRMRKVGVPLHFVLLQYLFHFIWSSCLSCSWKAIAVKKVSLWKSLPSAFVFLFMYCCFTILIGETRPRSFDNNTGFLYIFPLYFVFSNQLF